MIPLVPHHSVEKIAFPTLLTGQGATLFGLTQQLEQTQFMSESRIFGLQRSQLRLLFRHARDTVPFYRDRMAEAGFDPDGEITPETIRRIPVLKRTDVQSLEDAILSTAPPASHGKAYKSKSSGTTGRPVEIHKNALSTLMNCAFELRNHIWHNRDLRGSTAIIRYLERDQAQPPDGERFAKRRGLIGKTFQTGPTHYLNIASSLAAQAAWLQKVEANYLVTYPSNLLPLAEYFEENGLKLESLKNIHAISEVVSRDLRATCERVWGVALTDSYSCEEFSYLATQCPDHEHYHVQSENVYLEILNEAGKPCGPGECGQVFVTGLHNFVTPLIRYEVGDYAEVGEACSCGRGLPVLTRILGRKRNRLILPGGESRFPYLGEYRDYARITMAVRQFQFVQHSVEEVEMKLVVETPLTGAQEEEMRALIVESLGHPFKITLSYHGDIPRAPNGKFEEFVSKVASA